jgi:regulator of nonsense transcripts 1
LLKPGFEEFSAKDYAIPDELNAISLHVLVREKSTFAGQLFGLESELDALEALDSEVESNCLRVKEKVENYWNLLKRAEKEILSKSHVVLATCASSGSPHVRDVLGSNNVCREVIIDEAGQATEPELLVPGLLASKALFILGDHKQLQPSVMSAEDAPGAARALGCSILERLAKTKAPELLSLQYRMHPDIAAFPNKYFYEGKMKNDVSTLVLTLAQQCKEYWPRGSGYPCSFRNTVSVESKQNRRHLFRNRVQNISSNNDVLEALTAHPNSILNEGEAQEVLKAIISLLCHPFSEKGNPNPIKVTIRVITPYLAQQSLLELLLKKQHLSSQKTKRVTIGSVHSTQGGEADFVILSCVRSIDDVPSETKSSPRLEKWLRTAFGMVADDKLLNVCMTRARHGLLVFGNEQLLRLHKVRRSGLL